MLQDLPVWLAHFRSQAAHPRQVPATLADMLTGRERRLIGTSIATFQLGESSEGAHLRRAVRQHRPGPEGTALVEIFDLFIAEEQRHARLLGDFMQDHEIAPRERAFTDRVFRGLRRLGGLEARLRILLIAEIIGIVFYRALEVVTDCRRLQILCRTLAADELVHVAFESQLLLAMKSGRSGFAKVLLGACEQGLLGTAALLVWLTHRRVLKCAGYGPLLFVHDCRSQYDFYLKWPPAPRASRRSRLVRPLSPHGS
ncbi:MAG TPA: ferritin-like domain-containing protein [Steroidobacteraceae bacterium]|nr:ferritin-like domain-containing protein [Steroidobacteraceae bacterium]